MERLKAEYDAVNSRLEQVSAQENQVLKEKKEILKVVEEISNLPKVVPPLALDPVNNQHSSV